ncbi:MAG: hypothetical protein RR620_11835 [Clostridium sp.]
MRRVIKLIVATMFLCNLNIEYVNAEELSSPIIIDGNYEDWSDKPSIIDVESDGVNSHEDLKELRYITDENYLYLYVERYPVEGEYKNQGLWDIWIPIINGNGNGAHNTFLPWDKVEGEVWYPQKVSTFKITTAFVEVWDSSVQAMVKEFRVRVKLGEDNIGEDRVFRNADGSKFEIRLPLSLVGLNGNDEVIFSLASNISAPNDDIDWIYSDGPIHNTQGPIFGILTGVISLGMFVWVAKVVYKK